MYILSINHLKLLVKLTKYAIQANTLICKYPHRGGGKLWGPSCGVQAAGSNPLLRILEYHRRMLSYRYPSVRVTPLLITLISNPASQCYRSLGRRW